MSIDYVNARLGGFVVKVLSVNGVPFVYAIYGYVATLDNDIRQWFISKYMIQESEHLLNHKKRNRNLLEQADDIVKKTDGRRLTLEMVQTAEGQNIMPAFWPRKRLKGRSARLILRHVMQP